MARNRAWLGIFCLLLLNGGGVFGAESHKNDFHESEAIDYSLNTQDDHYDASSSLLGDIYEDEENDGVDEYAARDPLEGFNRAMFDFNMALNKIFLRPVTEIYVTIVPGFFRGRVHDFFGNLSTPLTMVNDLLQGDGERFLNSTARFLFNTIFGIFGLFDVATAAGLEDHSEDLDQTLATWDVESGPYLVLPIFGPTTFRGVVGMAGDYYMSPFNVWARHNHEDDLILYRSGAQVLDKSSRNYKMFDRLESDSLDYYATIRSLYFQHQLSKINNDDIETSEIVGAPVDAFISGEVTNKY